MHTDLSTLADVPALTLAADGGKVTTRIPVARLGSYKDRRYGAFKITEQDLSGWQKNLAHFNGEVPIDYDHGPEKGGSSEAAGWISSLEREGQRVMASVTFTPQGAQAIRDGRWKFISPTFVEDLKDEQGRSLGPGLKGAGLTNRPFLKRDMPAISLSEDVTVAGLGDFASSDSRRCMRLSTKTARALHLSEDVDETVLLSTLDDAVILTADDHRTLVERADEGDKAVKALAAEKFDTAWTAAAARGAATEPMKESVRTLYDVNPEQGLKLLADLGAQVPMSPQGVGAGQAAPSAPAGTDPTSYALDEQAHQLIDAAAREGRTLDYGDALDRAIALGGVA